MNASQVKLSAALPDGICYLQRAQARHA